MEDVQGGAAGLFRHLFSLQLLPSARLPHLSGSRLHGLATVVPAFSHVPGSSSSSLPAHCQPAAASRSARACAPGSNSDLHPWQGAQGLSQPVAGPADLIGGWDRPQAPPARPAEHQACHSPRVAAPPAQEGRQQRHPEAASRSCRVKDRLRVETSADRVDLKVHFASPAGAPAAGR